MIKDTYYWFENGEVKKQEFTERKYTPVRDSNDLLIASEQWNCDLDNEWFYFTKDGCEYIIEERVPKLIRMHHLLGTEP